jgi:hypothetical protein
MGIDRRSLDAAALRREVYHGSVRQTLLVQSVLCHIVKTKN